MLTMTTTCALPAIIRFDGIDDSGEFGNATCPHCGADGRYVHRFLTTEGPRAAMAGCVKLFPISKIAKQHQSLCDKQRTGKNLNSWDRKTLDAIERFYAGEITEFACESIIHDEAVSRRQWMKAKGYAR